MITKKRKLEIAIKKTFTVENLIEITLLSLGNAMMVLLILYWLGLINL